MKPHTAGLSTLSWLPFYPREKTKIIQIRIVREKVHLNTERRMQTSLPTWGQYVEKNEEISNLLLAFFSGWLFQANSTAFRYVGEADQKSFPERPLPP